MSKIKIFVSSVQKELEHERVAISSLITTDPFLMQHCKPVLFEYEPVPYWKQSKPYLKALSDCQIYLLLLFKEYGNLDGKLSATHHEYRHAQKLKLPTLVLIKGQSDIDNERATQTKAFIEEIRENKYTYRRFIDRYDLRSEVQRALITTLKERFSIEPSAEDEHCPTAAGLLLFGKQPADHYPQGEILVDAYQNTKISGKPRGQVTLNVGIVKAIAKVIAFIDKHTFHPSRVVGINNITLDEYPKSGLREALVNAVAHRNYEDGSRKIIVQVFADRTVISSPGYAPLPLTLTKLRRGNYRPCSRNPVIAQTLAALKLMEQRGSGFARMRDAMLNHGLDAPTYAEQDGYFIVTFYGPNGNYERLKVPEGAQGLVSPAVEARLNARQKKIMIHVQKEGFVTSGWCQKYLRIVRDTANRDLAGLIELGFLEMVGKGRSTRYVLKSINGEIDRQSSDVSLKSSD